MTDLTVEDLDRIEAAAENRHVWETVPADVSEVRALVAEVRRLRTQRVELARALLNAAQSERSRLATADYRRAVADRWIDVARAALPALPTGDGMAGAFATGEEPADD